MESGKSNYPLQSAKKRGKSGRMQDVMKKIRLTSHEEGEPCFCKRLKCFDVKTKEERATILSHFNDLSTNNEQNSYLCGLISITPVQRRRNRKLEQEAKFHDSVFTYRVRVMRETRVEEMPVCFKAFFSIHGITKGKLEHLQKYLKNTGVAPKDMRGKHMSTIKKLSTTTYQKVYNHIQSFKGRLSHYSLHDTKKLYLPEDLNIKKMFRLFKENFSDTLVSYETYRNIFNTKFNISFGQPRSDTCSICDKFTAETNRLKLQENSESTIRKLQIENEVHKRKAQGFYDKKRSSKRKAQGTDSFLAIAMDYQKNVYLPNVPTNEVYYLRQLSMYTFNVHVLSDKTSLFYAYPEFFLQQRKR